MIIHSSERCDNYNKKYKFNPRYKKMEVLGKDRHIALDTEKYELVFCNPKTQTFEKIKESENRFKRDKEIEKFYIWDINEKFKFDIKFIEKKRVGGIKSLLINNKYSTPFDFKEDDDLRFLFAFNYKHYLFYVTSEWGQYHLYSIELICTEIFDFIYEKMENYNFSEQDVKLSQLFIDDFLHPIPAFNRVLSSPEKEVNVCFLDGEKKIKIKTLFDLKSEFVLDTIDNLQENENERIVIFSELTFYEFERCFCKEFRANSSKTYLLLHKIASLLFSEVAIKFVKLFSKIKKYYENLDEKIYLTLFEHL